jgi:hypothetical protein
LMASPAGTQPSERFRPRDSTLPRS